MREHSTGWSTRALLALCWALLYTGATWADEGLARLTFWAPPERMGEFEAAYEERIAPFLRKHGLVVSDQRSRPTIDSVFSRLVTAPPGMDLRERLDALGNDPAYWETLQALGETFGVTWSDGSLRWGSRFYSAPMVWDQTHAIIAAPPTPVGQGKTVEVGTGRRVKAGPGTTTDPAGPGTRVRAGSGQAVDAGAGIRSGTWQSFGVLDGLPGPTVSKGLQDRDGRLWFGMMGEGVALFDGARFTTFTAEDGLASNMVFSLLQDREGQMWFGTGRHPGGPEGKGVSRYDGEYFTTFTRADGLVGDTVLSIAEDSNGHLWFGTTEGVSRYDGERFTNFTMEDGLVGSPVWTIVEDRRGHMWFGVWGGASRYDGEHFTNFTVAEGLPHREVYSMVEDGEGHMWFGTVGGGIARYDGQHLTTFGVADGLADGWVRSMALDRQGHLWLGFNRGGVQRFDGRNFINYTIENGLPGNGIHFVLVDRENHLWCGAINAGISRHDGNRLTLWQVGEDWNTTLMMDRRGELWVGALGRGVMRLKDRADRDFAGTATLSWLAIWSMLEGRDGAIWLATGFGLARYEDGQVSRYDDMDGLADRNVKGLFEDDQGRLWSGGWSGLGVSRYDGEGFTTYTTADGLAGNRVPGITQDRDGAMWFATDGGVSRYDGEQFSNFTTADGLASNKTRALLQDRRGHMWFATDDAGVSRYDGARFTNFTTADGLGLNAVLSLFEDRDGDIWFATNGGGASRYDGLVFQTLSSLDGLPGGAIQDIVQDDDGSIWLAAERGLANYRPGSEAPVVYINAVAADRPYGQVAQISLPTSQDYLRVEFRGGSLTTPPDRMAYVYRLQGYQDEWLSIHLNRVEYFDLPRGDYVFQVKAVDRDLNYSAQPAEVRVEIHLPYERLGWGLGLGLALVAIVVLGAKQIQSARSLRVSNDQLGETNRALEQQTETLRQARQAAERAAAEAETANRAKSQFLANISHEIRTPMNAILGYTQLLQKRPDLDSQHSRDLASIRTSGDHLLRLINEVLDLSKIEAGRVQLNPVDFDLGVLLASLASIFEMRCREKGLAWRLEFAAAGSVPVRGDEAKLTQVLINLLGNAVKFTPAGDVVLAVAVAAEGQYRFEVRDTGMGIAAEEQEALFQPFYQGATGADFGGTGLGLAIAHEQVELMGGHLQVESALGEGAAFSFAVPLPPAESDLVQQAGRIERLSPGVAVRALVADDVADNREILRRMLTDLGAEVELAEDGRQALERLEGNPPDIVFLDIRMPVLDGMEVVRRIRANPEWEGLRVVAISASVLGHERSEFLAAGFDEFMGKPFRFAQLGETLGRLLGVEFAYTPEGERPDTVDRYAEWRGVEIPSELYAALVEAAELQIVTKMEQHLQELEGLGEMQGELAAHLRQLMQSYDMENILKILGDIGHG